MTSSYIWHIDRTLSGVTTPSQREPGSNDNEEVLYILKSSSITGTSPSDGTLVGGGAYPSAEMQLVYSTAPAQIKQKYKYTNTG